MLAVHFRNGDGSPPTTAFTADDSYPDKESRREDDREKARIRIAKSRFTLLQSDAPVLLVLV